NDLDDAQFAWCSERMVPEAPQLIVERVDLSPLQSGIARTWVRPTRDAIIGPDKQLAFAHTVGGCDVIDLDAGHMCMISQAAKLAAILEDIAARATSRRGH